MSTLSERATANVGQMEKRDRPLSERFRLAAMDFVEKHRTAKLLEERKTLVLSQMIAKHIKAHGPLAFNKAENDVKSSDDWDAYVTAMVEARYEADKAKVYRDTLEMKFSEWQSSEANERAERRTSRAQT